MKFKKYCGREFVVSLLFTPRIEKMAKKNAVFCDKKAQNTAYGWGSWIRTNEVTESESVALPLGYTPITAYLRILSKNPIFCKRFAVIFKIFLFFLKQRKKAPLNKQRSFDF